MRLRALVDLVLRKAVRQVRLADIPALLNTLALVEALTRGRLARALETVAPGTAPVAHAAHLMLQVAISPSNPGSEPALVRSWNELPLRALRIVQDAEGPVTTTEVAARLPPTDDPARVRHALWLMEEAGLVVLVCRADEKLVLLRPRVRHKHVQDML